MISVIVPTYKNKVGFLNNLKHNSNYFSDCEIIIVNDNSSESLKDDLKNYKKNLILLENKKNLGFGQSINIGVKVAKNKFVMLLNDDVILLNDSFKVAPKYFQEDKFLFAISFAQKEKDGSIVGKNSIYWKNGLFYHKKANNLSFGHNAWAEGGACIIDKDKFEQLGGFDPIYFPFYWEDIDLSYRAWKIGYRIYFEPKIFVEHHHETTIRKFFDLSYIKTIAFRNQFIFIWKNITDPFLIINNLLYLPFNLIYYLLKHENEFLVGFIAAIKKIAKIKNINRKLFPLTDKKVLSLFK